MMNYIKSECYRVTHTKDFYAATGILAALVLLLNTAIHFFGGRYATTSFSYCNLVASPMIFVVAGELIAYFLYEGNRKNGNLKNTVASGISRSKIFAGQCIITAMVSTFLMVFTLAAWMISAEMLLEKTGPVKLREMLLEGPMMYLIAVAGLISGIVFLELFEKNIMGMLLWVAVWFFIPKMFVYLAMRFEALSAVTLWFPANFLGINGQHVNMTECITIWDTAEGMARCVLSGIIGTVFFAVVGVMALRKKDL